MLDKSYRCFYLRDGHIMAAEFVKCDNDAAALVICQDMLNQSTFEKLEVWDGGRKVATITRRYE